MVVRDYCKALDLFNQTVKVPTVYRTMDVIFYRTFHCQALESGDFDAATDCVAKNLGVKGFVNFIPERSEAMVMREGRKIKFQYRHRDVEQERWSLLHYALAYNHVEMAELLIQEGAGTDNTQVLLHYMSRQ